MALPDAKTVIDAGGIIVQVLGSKLGAAPAPKDLQVWVDTYKVTKTALMDPPGAGTVTLTAFEVRETCVIIDLRTMVIVEKVNGSTTGSGISSVGQLLPKLVALVTK